MEGNDKRTLKKLASELDGWRKENPSSRALPASIWSGAADVARRVGVGPVAKALRRDHSKLKQLTLSSGNQPPVLAATFVELLPLGSHVLGDCAVEVESPYGARMRIQLQGRVENARKPHPCLATFVELLPVVPSTASPTGSSPFFRECALEVDSADGLRLKVTLKGLSAGSLVEVLRQFAQGNG